MTLLVHASSQATAGVTFPADEPPDRRGTTRAAALRGHLPRAAHRLRAPDRTSAGTCAALGLTTDADPGLRDWETGRWTGRSLDDVAAAEPDAVTAWLTDPTAAPHGGESLLDLLGRVRDRLAELPAGHTLAVCGPAVARAAVVVVMGAPPTAFWRLDAAPLSVTDLRGGPDRWRVRSTGGEVAARG